MFETCSITLTIILKENLSCALEWIFMTSYAFFLMKESFVVLILTIYPIDIFIAVGASWKWYQWVEGQNTRRFASWRFFDRTSYKPSSSPDEIVLHGRAPLSHVTPYRYFSNKMTPKDHLAAGPTAKVVVLKDLSNRTYPNLANLKLTFLETKK